MVFISRSIVRAGVDNVLVKLNFDFFWVHLVTAVTEGVEEVSISARLTHTVERVLWMDGVGLAPRL